MANPYSAVTITNYNLSPPTDDGAATGANQIKWSSIKTKLGDPLDVALVAVDASATAAFAKILGGGSTTSTSTDTTAAGADQGKTFVLTGSVARALTVPVAATVAAPFALGVQNNATANLTLTPQGAETINGAASVVVGPGQGGFIVTDGSKWFYIGGSTTNAGLAVGTKALFFQTSAPSGWTKDTSFDDAAIALTTGTVSDVAGTALSSVLAARTVALLNLPDFGVSITDPGHFHSQSLAGSGGGIQSGSGISNNTASGSTGSKGTGITAAFGTTARGGAQTTMDFAAKRALAIRATKN